MSAIEDRIPILKMFSRCKPPTPTILAARNQPSYKGIPYEAPTKIENGMQEDKNGMQEQILRSTIYFKFYLRPFI